MCLHNCIARVVFFFGGTRDERGLVFDLLFGERNGFFLATLYR